MADGMSSLCQTSDRDTIVLLHVTFDTSCDIICDSHMHIILLTMMLGEVNGSVLCRYLYRARGG